LLDRVRRILVSALGALVRAPRRLRDLEADERLLLLQAPVALAMAGLALRRWGLAGTVERMTGGRAGRRPPPTEAARRAKARRLAWCVQVTSAYLPWGVNCLRRSVVALWFLHRCGLEPQLRIGIRRGEDGALDFHAWVEYEGEVINDRRDVTDRYVRFEGEVLPPRASFA
jgi:hypothetical protein